MKVVNKYVVKSSLAGGITSIFHIIKTIGTGIAIGKQCSGKMTFPVTVLLRDGNPSCCR